MDYKTITQQTDVFLRMIDEDHIYLCPDLDYHTVCGLIGALPKDLDESLLQAVGHDGRTLMELMRSAYLSYVSKKYGISIDFAR